MIQNYVIISSSILGIGCYHHLIRLGHNVSVFLSYKSTDSSMSSINISTSLIEKCVSSPIVSFNSSDDSDNIRNILKHADPRNTILLVVGFPRLISKSILSMGWRDCLGFHMSDLPEGKGRSPQIYTILNKTSNICSCLFRLTPNADDGQIISKHCVSNSSKYKLEDIFDITFSLAHKCIDDLIQNKPYKFHEEDKLITETIYPRRYPKDSEIGFSSSFDELLLLLRAQREPYPLPFIYLNDTKLTLIEFTCHDLDENITLDNFEFFVYGHSWKICVKKFTIDNYKPILQYDTCLLLQILSTKVFTNFRLEFSPNILATSPHVVSQKID